MLPHYPIYYRWTHTPIIDRRQLHFPACQKVRSRENLEESRRGINYMKRERENREPPRQEPVGGPRHGKKSKRIKSSLKASNDWSIIISFSSCKKRKKKDPVNLDREAKRKAEPSFTFLDDIHRWFAFKTFNNNNKGEKYTQKPKKALCQKIIHLNQDRPIKLFSLFFF